MDGDRAFELLITVIENHRTSMEVLAHNGSRGTGQRTSIEHQLNNIYISPTTLIEHQLPFFSHLHFFAVLVELHSVGCSR